MKLLNSSFSSLVEGFTPPQIWKVTKSGLGPPIDKGIVLKSLQKTQKDTAKIKQCLAGKRNFKLSSSLFIPEHNHKCTLTLAYWTIYSPKCD